MAPAHGRRGGISGDAVEPCLGILRHHAALKRPVGLNKSLLGQVLGEVRIGHHRHQIAAELLMIVLEQIGQLFRVAAGRLLRHGSAPLHGQEASSSIDMTLERWKK